MADPVTYSQLLENSKEIDELLKLMSNASKPIFYTGGGVINSGNAANFENLLGTDNDDTLNGDANANIIVGSAGADTINGNDGNDTLWGDCKTSACTSCLTFSSAFNEGLLLK